MAAPSVDAVTRRSSRRGPPDCARLAGAGEQCLVDVAAGQGADLRADHGAGDGGAKDGEAGGQQRRADRGAGNSKSERSHQDPIPGNEKAATMWRRHQVPSGTSPTAAPSIAWIMRAGSVRMPTCLATARGR